MNKRYSIAVRRYLNGTDKWSLKPEFETVETIHRVIFGEAIGNFNPFFCRYRNNKRVLIHSDQGDISDPFRRDESYADSLFIILKEGMQS